MRTETRASLKTLAQGVKMTCEYGSSMPWDKLDDWQKKATGYRCTLRYQGRRYTIDFFMGPAHTDEPDGAGVLDCLLSDAQLGTEDFAEFCQNLGYDEDSRKAERMHKACEKTAAKLERLLGEDYDTFISADRDV